MSTTARAELYTTVRAELFTTVRAELVEAGAEPSTGSGRTGGGGAGRTGGEGAGRTGCEGSGGTSPLPFGLSLSKPVQSLRQAQAERAVRTQVTRPHRKQARCLARALLAAPERLQRTVRTSSTSGAWPCIRRGQVVACMGLRTYSPGRATQRPDSCRSAIPRQLSFVTFFFARKESYRGLGCEAPAQP